MLFSVFPIEYNDFQFHSWNNKVATYGRWCGFRYQMSEYSLKEFKNYFQK